MDPIQLLNFKIGGADLAGSEPDIRALLTLVWPDDKGKELEFKLLIGGLINNIYKVTYINSGKSFVIRVFTERTRLVWETTDVQVLGMRAAQEAGLGAEVIAAFTNGLLYSYQPGETINPDVEKFREGRIRRKVMQLMAKFHQIEASETVVGGKTIPKENLLYRDTSKYPALYQWDEKNNTLFKDSKLLCSKTNLEKEFAWALAEVKELDASVTFCHYDMWWPNIIYDGKADTVSFLDFDSCGYGPFVVDLARFISTVDVRMNPLVVNKLEEAEERELCRIYIEEYRKLGSDSNSVTDNDVDILYALTLPYRMVFTMYFLVKLLPAYNLLGIENLALIGEELYFENKNFYLEYKDAHPEHFVKNWSP